MGEIKVATLVQAIHHALVVIIAASVAEAHEVERHGGYNLAAIVALHPLRELMRESDVATNVELKTLHSVMANYKPQLQ
ncbi:MAG TPA: hypothetical protein VF783_14610, partial [Terriglobales bacterium]